MKKNKMMRLSAILLVAVLLSLSVISGTWAKYVTSEEQQSQVVTVAKWGVELEGSVAEAVFNIGGSVQDNAIKVAAQDESGLWIAPGAELKLCEFDIEGNPEVASQVTYTVSLTFSEGWEVDAEEYCPLVFYVNGVELKIEALNESDEDEEITSIQALKEAIAAEIAKLNGEYAPNEDLSGKDLTITCKWVFESDNEGDNEKDTKLASQETMPKFNFSISCEVVQLDEYTPAA